MLYHNSIMIQPDKPIPRPYTIVVSLFLTFYILSYDNDKDHHTMFHFNTPN